MINKTIKGTGVAMITPFTDDNKIDFISLEKLTNHLIKGGIDFLVLLGTTGETSTLTKEEQNNIINHVIEINNQRLPIVIGAGGNDTASVINKITSLKHKKIDALLSVVPYYNKPSQQGIFRHFKSISERSEFPVILYNVPARTGCNIIPETVVKLSKLPKIVAIKEASGNLSQSLKIITEKPENFKLFSGDDELTLPLYSCGSEGVISVIANAFPKEFSQITHYALSEKYKKAQIIYYQLIPFIHEIFSEGNPSGIKYLLSKLGICKNNLRLPLYKISEKNEKNIDRLLKAYKSKE